MTSRATPPDQHEGTVPQPDAPRQPMTRREAREMRERAEREAQQAQANAQAAQAQTQAQPTAPVRQTVPPQQTAPVRQTAPVQQTIPARPTAPVQQTVPPQQTTPVRPAAPVRPPRPEATQPEAAQSDLAWLHHLTAENPVVDGGGNRKPPRTRGRGRRAAIGIVSTVVILGLVGGGAFFAWNTFQPQVQSVLQHFHHTPVDYTGDGTGTVDITINQGDSGETIAGTLAKAGVTLTPQAFYQLLLATKPDPVFEPGVYQLRKHMSAASALALLQDPKSKLAHTLLIREGAREGTILTDAAAATGIPLAQLQAAAKSPAEYGLPPQAKTLEGFLFPATYTFNPGTTADQVIGELVNRAKQAFEEDGVPTSDPTKLWNTVVLASVVQAEAGPNPADLPKIAGVFDNRIAKGMPLQSDATVHYGLQQWSTVFTTDAQRADASNLYNTYVHTGLPPGPIGNPGDTALQAALHPEGDYLYFTTINLQTGETAFATTLDGQNANVAKLQEWCQQPANKSYCQ